MECVKCGFTNPENARFCSGCGASVAQIECTHCHSKNPPGSRFCNACGHTLAAESKSAESPITSHAERRLLTVLFCDLVDSTIIVDNLDPEETRAIIRDFQSLSRKTMEQFGGRITEYLGDGIVVQFTRHETNAERAVNAALELIRKLDDANIIIGSTDQKVRVRCGIATGLAVVGDMLGDTRIRSESAIGLPLNLAARIQNLANPGEIVIAGDTYRLTRGLFEFEDLGPHHLKGIKDPHQVWRVLKEKHVSSRFNAHTVEITPMVDREETMDVLLNCWESSKRGKADAVIFSGEAGIGKSRILQELGKKIADDDYFYLEYQCAPYHTNTALYPIISRLEAAAEFEHADSQDKRLEKLEALISRSSHDYENVMPVFVNLLSLSAQDKWPTPNLDPDEKKEWIFNVLINNMFSLSESKTLLIKIEDVHWIDPTTLELMSRMVKSLSGHRILLLITSRPGFEADFLSETNVTLLEIDRLPEQYTAELVEGVKGSGALPKDVIDEIIQRTEGIPLFVEELSKSLMERMESIGSSATPSSLAKKDIPTTLHDSLLSRLDRLPDASRSIAQLAAVIGRDFSFDLLEQIADYQDKNLYRDLTPLLESQLVFQDKAPPSAEFCFKHALVRDVAYENLLQSERVDIHKRIAQAIEKNYPEIINNSPELVARHFTEGKEYEKAVQYWLEAGKKASQQFALIEAREHLTAGLKNLSFITDGQKTKFLKLEILVTLGTILIALEGSGAAITKKNYSEAVKLCEQLPASNLHFAAIWGQWLTMDYKGNNSLEWASKLEDMSSKLGDIELELQAHHCQWTTLYHCGYFKDAYDHIIKSFDIYNSKLHSHHASIYGGHDPNVCAHGFLSHVLWFLGRDSESSNHAVDCFRTAEQTNHTGSKLHAIELNLLLSQYKAVPKDIEYWTVQLEEICSRVGLPEYQGKLMCCKGIILANKEDYDGGIKLMKSGLADLEATGTTEDIPLLTDYLAKTLAQANRPDEALKQLNNHLEVLEKYSIRYWHSELYRRKAELLFQLGLNNKALKYFKHSIVLAREQNALMLELRTALSQYKFNNQTGLLPNCQIDLSEVCDKFSSDSISPEFLTAKKILNS